MRRVFEKMTILSLRKDFYVILEAFVFIIVYEQHS